MARRRKTTNPAERFVRYPIYIKNTFAWRQLTANAKLAWLEIGFFYNGYNNGRLCISSRRLGEAMGVSKSTAARAINELLTWGFLEITKASSFSLKKLSAEYRLTHVVCDVTHKSASFRFKQFSDFLKPQKTD